MILINKKLTIKICSAEDIRVVTFEKMLKEWVGKDFFIDFHGKHFFKHPQYEKLTIVLLMDNKKTLGGAVLSDGFSLNDFIDVRKIEKIKEYEKEGILNFSYFYLLEDYRNKGYGSYFLKEVSKIFPKTWLASKDKHLDFYQRNGYEIVYEKIKGEKSLLLQKAYKKDFKG